MKTTDSHNRGRVNPVNRRGAASLLVLALAVAAVTGACGDAGSGGYSSGSSGSYSDGFSSTWTPDGNLYTGTGYAFDSGSGCTVIVGDGVSC